MTQSPYLQDVSVISFISHRGMACLAYTVFLSLQDSGLPRVPDSTSLAALKLLWSDFLASLSVLVKDSPEGWWSCEENGQHSSVGMRPSQLLDVARNQENGRAHHSTARWAKNRRLSTPTGSSDRKAASSRVLPLRLCGSPFLGGSHPLTQFLRSLAISSIYSTKCNPRVWRQKEKVFLYVCHGLL